MADWFKIYENDIDEMRLQWAIGEMPEVLSVWVVLLSEACRHKSGILSGYTQDFELFGISKRINVSPPKVNACIQLLLKISYIEKQKDGSLLIRKWSDKQSEYCQKLTKRQNQNGDENPNSKVNRTKNTDIVGTMSGQDRDIVGQEERRGEYIAEEPPSESPRPLNHEISNGDVNSQVKVNGNDKVGSEQDGASDLPPGYRPPPLPKKSFRSPDPMAYAFLVSWKRQFKDCFGDPYVESEGKDMAAINRILSTPGIVHERVLEIAAKAWRNTGGFNSKFAVSISGFCSRFNEISKEVGALNGNKRKEIY